MLSKEVLMQLEEAENAKDLKDMAKKLGYDLTDAEAEKVFAMFERDLSEEELEKVAGGGIFDDLIQKVKDFKKDMDEALHPGKEHSKMSNIF